MAGTLICNYCHEPYVPVHVRPNICPKCNAVASWREVAPDTPPALDPSKPYDLNDGDRRFLRTLRIAADDD